MRRDLADALLTLLKKLEPIVVNRNTLRMIKEMATDDFPRPFVEDQKGLPQNEDEPDGGTPCPEEISPTWRSGMTADFFDPVTPYFLQRDLGELDTQGFNFTELGFPGEFDPDVSFLDGQD